MSQNESQTTITLADLIENVKLGGGSVITSSTELEPAAGPHASVVPAKYVEGKGQTAKSVFVYETRYIAEKPENQDEPKKKEDFKTAKKAIKGKPQTVVLIDSKQSELNRAEAAIEQGRQYGDEAVVKIPRGVVTYQTENGPVEYTDMELSHRIFDGHFRAGTIDGERITENDQYRALRNCTPADMSALLNTAPAALLFGAWDSTRKSNQVRLRSALVGEIIGVLADQKRTGEEQQARRSGARVDAVAASVKLTPKDMESLVNDQEAELSPGNIGARRNEIEKAKADARISASPLGLGSIPPSVEEIGGVACRRIIRSWVLSLASLRQLRFGQDETKNIAARALLAALGLNAIARAERELYIRANCDLIESAAPVVTLDQRFGEKKEFAPLTVEHTDQLLLEAIENAKKAGVADWNGQTFKVDGNPAIIKNATAEDAE
ncbi:type I-U CRISPR-associated RAMP protein Csb1/Cas7u [uncultured Rothia sp.]|uniref:type I-G CRISPR-associated RAMP protein Csb1/Cas7g n=1 Tax=uncultured Rothia sp. TaxID=316088 RepID=UPI0025EEB645|nr:type I-U CRISPR-associated RAMP protein Csb1/Cas7u [uncultured Rothia sp.]